jgi:hypothetical protein
MTSISPLAAALVLGAGLLLAPAEGRAQAPAPSAEAHRIESEAVRLRAELDRAHAEIAALKRERGVRNDYRLRQRMADAEALARRLTDAEAQLRRLRGGAPVVAQPVPLGPPAAAPGDGPVELEAKADLLSDQARRMAAEADALARAAGQLRSRQTLRRRAGQLERDPFAGLDASKRSMVFGRQQAVATKTGGGAEGLSDSAQPPPGDMPRTAVAGSQAMPAPPPPPGAPGAAPAPSPTPAPTAPTAPSPVTPPAPTTTFSPQSRALLDPATLADLQRLERSGVAPGDPAALERAAAALRQRAQALEAQSKALRKQATGR